MGNMQRQGLAQTQVQIQTQTLSPIQVMAARLTELPVDALRERIEKELDDNHWLEASYENTSDGPAHSDTPDENTSESYQTTEGEHNFEDDDPSDNWEGNPNADANEKSHFEISDQDESFYDHLTAQMGEYDLDEHQHDVMQYLIGSLDGDGLLHTSLLQIQDELEIYHAIDTTPEELQLLLSQLQQMDPPGVGARNLQECLTLQAKRYYQGETRDNLVKLFSKYWDDFAHLRWKRIQHVLKLDDLGLDQLRQRIRKLNPRPGGSIGSGRQSGNHAITPDFYVDVDEYGAIHLSLNEGELPKLTVSPDAEITLQMPTVSKAEREAQKYLREDVESAQMFIDAIAQRRTTLLMTMKAIIKLQRPFFLEGDETLLRPMKLEDVGELTHQDISTVSRVSNSKYVQTQHGTYPLRWFFTTAAIKDGEEVSIRKILDAIRQLVDGEDKSRPLSDERLATILRERGYDVARRTVAKYRTQLGIAESRMRKL